MSTADSRARAVGAGAFSLPPTFITRPVSPVPPMPSQETPSPKSSLVTALLLQLYKASYPGSSGGMSQTKVTLQTSVTNNSSAEQEACFGSALNCIQPLPKLPPAQLRETEDGRAQVQSHSGFGVTSALTATCANKLGV